MDYTTLKDYLDQGISSYKIAELEKKSQTTIRHWMKKFGLKSQHKAIKDWSQEDFFARSAEWRSNQTNGNELDWQKIQLFYDEGKTWNDICDEFKTHTSAISDAQKKGLFISRRNNETLKLTLKSRPPIKLSDETKKKISEGRKKYLAENPDKHGWSNSNHHYSVPCELLKSKLKDSGVSFIEEFQPLREQGRYFSIDIYFPDLKIGWEVNGNQHYESDGSLKPYYQNRHELIEAVGIKLIEIKYHKVFSESFVLELIDSLSIK